MCCNTALLYNRIRLFVIYYYFENFVCQEFGVFTFYGIGLKQIEYVHQSILCSHWPVQMVELCAESVAASLWLIATATHRVSLVWPVVMICRACIFKLYYSLQLACEWMFLEDTALLDQVLLIIALCLAVMYILMPIRPVVIRKFLDC